MRLKVKVEDKAIVVKDMRSLLKSGKYPLLVLSNKLHVDGTELRLDLSYSTILGYSKESLAKTLEVLTENIYNPRINDVFGTKYSQDELNGMSMYILNNSIKITQKEVVEEGLDEPSFVDMVLTFKAALVPATNLL